MAVARSWTVSRGPLSDFLSFSFLVFIQQCLLCFVLSRIPTRRHLMERFRERVSFK
jgi:hypothetical protein